MEMTGEYLSRSVDSRMIRTIQKYCKGEKILDLGCGSGVYGKFIKPMGNYLIGLDYDTDLCKSARETGYYDEVISGDLKNIDHLLSSNIDVIFCSEVLEHLSNDNIKNVLLRMEEKCNKRIIITVPNPLSPHFSSDKTHILNYNIFSLLKILNQSKKFNYSIYPLGFSDGHLEKLLYKIINIFSKRLAIASSTVLYVGERITY